MEKTIVFFKDPIINTPVKNWQLVNATIQTDIVAIHPGGKIHTYTLHEAKPLSASEYLKVIINGSMIVNSERNYASDVIIETKIVYNNTNSDGEINKKEKAKFSTVTPTTRNLVNGVMSYMISLDNIGIVRISVTIKNTTDKDIYIKSLLMYKSKEVNTPQLEEAGYIPGGGQGPIGPEGPQGPAGPQGPQGIQGPMLNRLEIRTEAPTAPPYGAIWMINGSGPL